MVSTMMILAETAAATAGSVGDQTMVSGAWVTGFVVAVLGAVGTMMGYRKGRASTTTLEPTPLPVHLVRTLATKDELSELEARVLGELKKLEGLLSKERDLARTANSNLHSRIDRTSESLSEIKGQLVHINDNMSRLIDLAIHKPNTPKTR